MILKGDHITLRTTVLADAPRYVKWLTDPQVVKFLQKRHGLTLAKEKSWIKNLLSKESKVHKHFAIIAPDGEHIGSAALRVERGFSRQAVFGIFIGEKRYWNKGLGSDATRTILRYGFEKLKLHRIELNVHVYNPRAIRVYKKMGFRKEGVRREHNLWNNKFHDSILMGMLEGEWFRKHPRP